ncbi:hypothetical protein [Parafrankia sp. EUN1f]|nr:hypothetical protein [Parafrankia sp. EUN1f]
MVTNWSAHYRDSPAHRAPTRLSRELAADRMPRTSIASPDCLVCD